MRLPSFCRAAVVCTAIGALAPSLAPNAIAKPHLMYLPGHDTVHRHLPAGSAGSILYYGGPVFSQVKVISVMWGPKVNAQVVADIGGFFGTVTNSTWFDIMAQYATDLTGVDGHAGTDQTIGRGTYVSQVVITPHNAGTTLTDRAVQKELLFQIKAKTLPKPDANVLYMIYFPPGVTITIGKAASCSAFGAYHEGFSNKALGGVFYGVMPDCGYGFSTTTVISSHELAEATTDNFPTPGSHPAYPQAWNSSGGEEIADVCEGTSATVTAGKASYSVQQIYSNTLAGCSVGNYKSP
jgi:hypothetical protein